MEKTKQFLRRFWDRRKRDERVPVDRRHTDSKDARAKLNESVERLREEIAKHTDIKREVANDRQQTVIFSTYREICKWKGPELGRVKLCRSAKHPDAINDDIQICNEDKCPMLTAALRGEAA